jgi:hypothetical protein
MALIPDNTGPPLDSQFFLLTILTPRLGLFDKRTAVMHQETTSRGAPFSRFPSVVGFLILLLVVVLIALHRARVSGEPPR